MAMKFLKLVYNSSGFVIQIVAGFEKTSFHTHNIQLTISPEMDYWLNTLSYSIAGFAPKPRVWFCGSFS